MNWIPWIRAAFLGAALAAWFWTQSKIGRRPVVAGKITDRVHEWTADWNASLQRRPRLANGLLIASSFLVDALGLFVIVYSIFGPSVRPLVALLLIFSLRQLCQATTALPAPDGMIWRDPGFPSFLVTYGVSNDLFFSGHTAIAILGSVLLGSVGSGWMIALGLTIALFEVAVVLVLRAHYTLDVFTGAVVALWLWGVSHPLAGVLDRAAVSLLSG